ncbi:MAG: RNA polymerase sigma-70 factor [Muribaculaceae bacterium]|nr:RNA polymerase sigma-70 factor [Muribaculaceae bacterium]
MSDYNEIFKKIFDENHRRLLFLALRFLKNEADAEDLVADVFCDLWSRIETVDLECGINAYLYKAVSTRALNFLTRNNEMTKRTEALESINEKRIEFIDRLNLDDIVHSKDIKTGINEALTELPEKCRRIFELSYIDGLKNKDIAKAMDISVRTVEAQNYKALRILRDKLKYLLTLLPVLFNWQ